MSEAKQLPTSDKAWNFSSKAASSAKIFVKSQVSSIGTSWRLGN
jgi:hypothetical protein